VKRRTSKLGAAAVALRPVRENHFARGTLVLSALSVASGVAAQQQPPSADELRSMYCVEVIRAEIGLQLHLISASDAAVSSATTPALRQQWIETSDELLQGLVKLEVVRYRLQAYMLPRIPALDSSALAAAVRQGDADFEESTAGADRCVECNAPQVMNQQPLLCGAACSDKAQLSRVSACETPTWLPP
jgi:hypothetical protein